MTDLLQCLILFSRGRFTLVARALASVEGTMNYYHLGNSTRSHAVGVPTDFRNNSFRVVRAYHTLSYPFNKPAQLNMPKTILSPTFRVIASFIYPPTTFHLVLPIPGVLLGQREDLEATGDLAIVVSLHVFFSTNIVEFSMFKEDVMRMR